MYRVFDRKAIAEIVANQPESARKLWIAQGSERVYGALIDEAKRQGVSFRVLPKEAFSQRFRGAKQHLCLEREDYRYVDPDQILTGLGDRAPAFLCAFDGVFDPQNLGNIIRSAACLGVDAIVLPQDRSCGITDTVERVAKGSLAHVKIARVVNLARFLAEVKKRGFFCYGLDEQGEVPLWNTDLTGRVCLVLGSEEGLRRLTRERCDLILKVPTVGTFSTLNVASCFAAAAYEIERQRMTSR